MANVKKCDRCGNYYDPYGSYDTWDIFKKPKDSNTVFLCTISDIFIKSYDLCKECISKVVDFIEGKEDNNVLAEGSGSDT